MNPRSGAVRFLVLAALGLAVLAPSAVAAPATVFFNLTTAGQVQPSRVFFQADAGPYLDALQWTGWGSAAATATGTWILDCSNGGPSCGSSTATTRHPATFTLTDLAPCPRFGAGATVYRRGSVAIDEDGTSRTVALDSGDAFCARRPSAAAARAAVRSFARRRLRAHAVTVRCHVVSGIDLDCTARWTTPDGTRTHRGFGVSGRLNAGPRVTAYGI
jgi:hypothetical protein